MCCTCSAVLYLQCCAVCRAVLFNNRFPYPTHLYLYLSLSLSLSLLHALPVHHFCLLEVFQASVYAHFARPRREGEAEAEREAEAESVAVALSLAG
ncbi:hypothetical protein BCV69DRAFT_284413 [Microstroma glucosiphilum]|uniref:Uncharacterized protein n=1 Tax=Pseudomicrostroma glucosiphilum TaxID=1684307 RepID=A0A316U390_9BASI|nr:hypothetical protein BCV69DRAFT_284413 [Pseudomicrostroma glucosiphilum]PWN19264.1 hypothetical protein BCV69DRAFT_284413 [Pseudomicrostroma glucosiphilum]